jgi:hypothetical protein
MFDDYAGGMLVSVTSICKREPSSKNSKDWEKSVKFRRVYTSSEAVNRADMRQDKQRGGRLYLGEHFLEKNADEAVQGDPHSITYHIGDCEYSGDIRRLIGIVRWFPVSYRGTESRAIHGETLYPLADLIFVGAYFSEKASN